MEHYVITKNGIFLALTTEPPYDWVTPGTSIHKIVGIIPDLNTHVWDDATDTFVRSSTVYTRLAFLNLFTTSERIAIRTATNPIVVDFMNLLDVAEYVDTQNPDTQAGVNYLASLNLITPERAAEILG